MPKIESVNGNNQPRVRVGKTTYTCGAKCGRTIARLIADVGARRADAIIVAAADIARERGARFVWSGDIAAAMGADADVIAAGRNARSRREYDPTVTA